MDATTRRPKKYTVQWQVGLIWKHPMNALEQEAFTQGLMLLAEVYNRKISEVLLQTYWSCLNHYSFSLFKKTLMSFLKNPEYAKQGFPSPAAWIAAIEGDNAIKSLNAWTAVIKTIRRVGRYESVKFDDVLIHGVIHDMGGWIFLCQQAERELIFLQKEFERRYHAYLVTKKPALIPEYLMGYIEQQNSIHGFSHYIPRPVSVQKIGSMREQKKNKLHEKNRDFSHNNVVKSV